MNARPKAPPIYRPKETGVGVQLKPGNFRNETRSAPPVYRPQQALNSGVQPKTAGNFRMETRAAPPTYHPQQVQTNLQPQPDHNLRLENRPAPSIYRPQLHNSSTLQWKRIGFKPASTVQMVETRSSKKRTHDDSASGDLAVLHRGDSLSRGLERVGAEKHAGEDITKRKTVFTSLPDNVQDEVHRLAALLVKHAMCGVERTITSTYVAAVASIAQTKEPRSEIIGTNHGQAKATFRMVGEIVGGKFEEVAGTSYLNYEGPPGAYDTETQRSHVVPSMLLTPEDRGSRGNAVVEKSSFVNQSYDRGSENKIFEVAKKIDEPVFVGVEFLV